jgi:hypothetical protein
MWFDVHDVSNMGSVQLNYTHMMTHGWLGKDLEGRGHGIIEVMLTNLSGETEEKQKKP